MIIEEKIISSIGLPWIGRSLQKIKLYQANTHLSIITALYFIERIHVKNNFELERYHRTCRNWVR